MIALLLVLNGFVLASMLFAYLRGVKLYRRFFIVLDRKTDAIDHALKELRDAKQKYDTLKEDVEQLKRDQFGQTFKRK